MALVCCLNKVTRLLYFLLCVCARVFFPATRKPASKAMSSQRQCISEQSRMPKATAILDVKGNAKGNAKAISDVKGNAKSDVKGNAKAISLAKGNAKAISVVNAHGALVKSQFYPILRPLCTTERINLSVAIVCGRPKRSVCQQSFTK